MEPRQDGMPRHRLRKKRRDHENKKNEKLHKLPYTEFVKCQVIDPKNIYY